MPVERVSTVHRLDRVADTRVRVAAGVASDTVLETAAIASRFGGKRLYRDAVSLASSSMVNAVLGMVFWAVAAALLPPERLGVMTAVLSAITAPAIVVAAGVGDAYTSLLPATGDGRVAIYRRGQRVFLALSVASGVVAGICTIVMIDDVRGAVGVAVLVALGTVSWAAFTLQNNTLTSIGRARWLPTASGVASIGKLALLPLLAVTIGWHSVELATVVSAGLVVAAIRPSVKRIIETSQDLPTRSSMSDAEAVRSFDRFAVRTLASAALSLGILTLTPFMVTAYAGPSEGALFALSLSIVQTLDFIGSAMGVSLVVHASNKPNEAVAMARSILIKAAGLATAGAIVISLAAPIGLKHLDAKYANLGGAEVIAVLCAGSVIRTVYMVWAALQRSRRNMRALLALNLATGIALLVTLPVFCERWGALGGAFSLLLAQVVLSGGAAVHFLSTRRRPERRTV